MTESFLFLSEVMAQAMVIDFHTHTFPDALAPRAVAGMAGAADMMNYSDGTASGLRTSMARAGIDLAVLAPVVTKPHQAEGINRAAAEINAHTDETGLVSLGGIHPDSEEPEIILRNLAAQGFRGVKLHPLFQGVPIDDRRYLRIVELAASLDLIVLIHAGSDPNYPGLDYASPKRLAALLREVPHNKIILAHMAGFADWGEAEALYGAPCYIDTAVALGPWRRQNGELSAGRPMSPERFVRAVRAHRVDRVLFGSDSPWSDEAEALEAVRSSGLTEAELEAVTGVNGARLLGLEI